MKILKTNNSQFDLLKDMPTSNRLPFKEKQDRPEFDFILEEYLKEAEMDEDEYQILIPRHGRFWDNGYEDVE